LNSFVVADGKPSIYKNRRCRVFAIVGFCFLIAVVVVSVTVTLISKDESASSVAGPTMAPTTFRETLGIKEQLVEVFGVEDFSNPNSTHSRALNWVVNEDPMELEPDAENLVQRFVMAYFYFATSQLGPWLSCYPPKEGERDDW
jgi:hypothetical protein